jgi:hydrogenase maturation protein HypF
VATIPCDRPILAVGADLKNSVTLVVDGQAFVSQHTGDLDHYEAFQPFEQTIVDLTCMYDVSSDDVLVAHDLHPQYASTVHAAALRAAGKLPVQHHRAHIASVLAEREAWHQRVVGVSFDGTGYGDDGKIWGGEFFAGSVAEGFERVLHLREAALAGGDAAARHPVQCAAGFLSQINGLPDLTAPPFGFPTLFGHALQLIEKRVRTFQTTSIGRLFDCCAALLGFTRAISFEGQAAMWLEHVAQSAADADAYSFPIDGDTLDFRPLLSAVAEDRLRGRDVGEIARAFHNAVARGLSSAVQKICRQTNSSIAVFSGGVFQNELLLGLAKELLERACVEVWTNHFVPPNDGGISLGQAALAAFGHGGVSHA